MLTLGVVDPLCAPRLSQPSVATLCSPFSLKRKIFLFSKFLLFYYYLKKKEKKSCGGDDDDAVDDNEYFIDIIEGKWNLAHHFCQPFLYLLLCFFFYPCSTLITSTIRV